MKQSQNIFLVEDVISYFGVDINVHLFLESLTLCYQNPTEIFDRIIEVNDTVFILKDLNEENKIKGYIFYNTKENLEIVVNGILKKCIYNGYALVNEAYRQTGALNDLLLYATQFYVDKYNGSYETLLFYAITSNPIAIRSYYKTFNNIRPLINETLTTEDLVIAENLKSKLFIYTENNGHPFTFKTYLPQRYTEKVRETFINTRIEEVGFLNTLGVDEKSGDRFLFYWTI
jgi:hypothetical protein